MRLKKGTPVLLADIYKARNGTYNLKAWCPFCCKKHLHGSHEAGHRSAHCDEESPWYRGGYYLKIDLENPENVRLLKEAKEKSATHKRVAN